MRFRELTPMLWTKDLEETVSFYRDVLGFECDSYDEATGWAHMHRDSIQLMFSFPNDQTKFKQATFTGGFYLYINGIDRLWEEIKDKVNICYPIEDFDYGMREFAIYDNNGYMLQFGQESGE